MQLVTSLIILSSKQHFKAYYVSVGNTTSEHVFNFFLVQNDRVSYIVVSHVLVTPAPDAVREGVGVSPIACPLGSLLHHGQRGTLQVPSPSHLGTEIYKPGGKVEAEVAQFRGAIVPREGVVVVVPTLS